MILYLKLRTPFEPVHLSGYAGRLKSNPCKSANMVNFVYLYA